MQAQWKLAAKTAIAASVAENFPIAAAMSEGYVFQRGWVKERHGVMQRFSRSGVKARSRQMTSDSMRSTSGNREKTFLGIAPWILNRVFATMPPGKRGPVIAFMGKMLRSLFAFCAVAALLAMGSPLRAATPDQFSLANPPLTQTTSSSSLAGAPLSTQVNLVVNRFDFTGNTVFTSDQLRQAIAGYVGRSITTEDLEDARIAVTRFYVDRGYISSGAVLPDQVVSDGVVKFQIVEGRLSNIELQFINDRGQPADHWLRNYYVLARVRAGSNGPLNLLALKDQLELLRQDPNLRSINAELRPGAATGQSVLDLQVREANPFQFGIQYSNRRPPSVGETALDLLASDKDLTGHGDLLAVRYDIADGPIDGIAFAGDHDYSIDYVVPITPSNTTFGFNYTRSDTVVGEQPFENLNITSESEDYAITLRQPIFRRPIAEAPADGHPGRPAMEFDLFISGAIRNNTTDLLGQPFDFSSGANNGVTRLTVARLGQELNIQSRQEAFSGRSVFSFGLPIFGATPNVDDQAGGQFVSWLGQAQYVRLLERIGPIPAHNWQFVARIAGQVADRPLVTLEQFSLGGVNTVRGYRENEFVCDQGVAGTLELRMPIIEKHETSVLDFVTFCDAGYGSNRSIGSPTDTLCSLGIGFLFNPNRHVSAQIYYGVPTTSFKREHDSAQDYGIHFNFLLLAY
jgi:hemolysin activation/secretion protein